VFSYSSKLKQTVTLVEKRVNENRSANPVRDLEFLAEYYSDKKQWAKVNAASRHALSVVDGVPSSLDVTPADTAFEHSKKWMQARTLKRDVVQIRLASLLLILDVLLAICCAVLVVSLENPRSFAADIQRLNLEIQKHPKDAQPYINRGWYLICYPDEKGHALVDSKADCNRALSLDPTSCNAHELQADLLLLKGDYAGAWNSNEKGSHKTRDYYTTRAQLAARKGDFGEEARSLENAYNCSSSANPHPPFVLSYEEIAEAFGRAGEFENSLRIALLEGSVKNSFPGWHAYHALVMQARYLVALGRNEEAVKVATAALSRSDACSQSLYAYRAKAFFNLGQYDKSIADASKSLGGDREEGSDFDPSALKVRAASNEKLGRAREAQSDRKMIEFLHDNGGFLVRTGSNCSFIDKALLSDCEALSK
jgi:tetratricopeptide (TPR) repeat protein